MYVSARLGVSDYEQIIPQVTGYCTREVHVHTSNFKNVIKSSNLSVKLDCLFFIFSSNENDHFEGDVTEYTYILVRKVRMILFVT